MSVSLRHTPVLCQNEGTHKDVVFTVGYPIVPSFLVPRMVDGNDFVQVKFECKEVDSPVKTAKLYTFCLSSEIVIDSEKVQSRQIESAPWALQRAVNQGRASPLTSLKLRSDTQF